MTKVPHKFLWFITTGNACHVVLLWYYNLPHGVSQEFETEFPYDRITAQIPVVHNHRKRMSCGITVVLKYTTWSITRV